jgi:hypothetical protein
MSDRVDEEFLATVAGVDIRLVRTDAPWTINTDALVVSVGPGGFGRLGGSLTKATGEDALDRLNFAAINSDEPMWFPGPLTMRDGSTTPVRNLILASAHEPVAASSVVAPQIEASIRGAATGAAAAIALGARSGARRIALPLLGLGVLRFDVDQVIEQTLKHVIEALDDGRFAGLSELIFVSPDKSVVRKLADQWPAISLTERQQVEAERESEVESVDSPEEFSGLAGGVSKDLVDPTEGIKLESDRLGVAPYVTMMATVIADPATPLPLSIGLFGEWGSGKSYFMGMLREQIKAMSAMDGAYLRNITQINFNAWHYSDTNLWASLGDEIFEQLSGPEASAETQRAALRFELKKAEEQRKALLLAANKARAKTVDLESELEQARQEQSVSAKELAVAMSSSKLLGSVWRSIGINDPAERGAILADQIRGVSSDFGTLRAATRGTRGKWVLAALAVFLILIAFAVVSANTTLLGAGLAGIISTAAAVFGVIRSAMRKLAEAADELRTSLTQQTESMQAQKLRDFCDAQNKEQIIRAQLEDLSKRANEVHTKLAMLDPAERFQGFVSDRMSSGEYRRSQGLVSTIRRDFEQLIGLLKDWKATDSSDAQKPIDRIVLYIDDLDRCSSEQVVEVLQAVHLLLAMDLFVVVVGVDPRWLLRSLQSHYREAFDTLSVPDSSTDRRSSQLEWNTTPLDYLEKIFNIPFVLPGMSAGSFGSLIDELSMTTGDGVDVDHATNADHEIPVPDVETGSAPATPGNPESGGGQNAGSMEPQDHSLVSEFYSGRRPKPRPLTKQERQLLASLGALVETPRQGKRLFNLYRLIRSAGDLRSASDFLGTESQPGEFQAVAVLLAILTANPHIFGDILWAEVNPELDLDGGLYRRSSRQTWSEFLASLTPERKGEGWGNSIARFTAEECDNWLALTTGLAASTDIIVLDDLAAFRTWGWIVARFSFVLSPFASTESSMA